MASAAAAMTASRPERTSDAAALPAENAAVGADVRDAFLCQRLAGERLERRNDAVGIFRKEVTS